MNIRRWIYLLRDRGRTFLALIASGSFPRAKNYFLASINMIRRPESVNHYPLTLVIDPGNLCNLSCALCITGQKKSLRPPKFLNFPDFKKIIDTLGKWAYQLDLYNWGEPFLNKDVFKMIAYAKEAGLRIETSSNLNFFSPLMAEETVKSGLDRLIVSLHGATAEMTRIYMRGGDFNRALKNLKLLIKTKKRLGSRTPSIIWRYVVSRYNEEGLERAKKLSQNLGVDQFESLPLRLDVGFDPSHIKNSIQKNSHWIPENKEFAHYEAKGALLLNNPYDCFWPWEIVAINPDGTVQPCCVFSNPAFDFGNLFVTPFAKIWNGKKYQTARRVIREKILDDQTTICGLCVTSNFIAK